jgi:nucleotide-binding universal stress UspA family protein
VIEIPPMLPFDAHMLEEEDDAHRLLDQVEALGASYGVSVSPRIVRARETAGAIVDQASRVRAELILIGVPRPTRRSLDGRMFRNGIEDVLRGAPCPVMVIASAPEQEARRAAA